MATPATNLRTIDFECSECHARYGERQYERQKGRPDSTIQGFRCDECIDEVCERIVPGITFGDDWPTGDDWRETAADEADDPKAKRVKGEAA